VHGITQIESITEFRSLFDKANGLVLDLRSKEDFDNGHLPGAKHLDLMSQDFIDFFTDLYKDASILLYCSDGSRSKVAVRILREMGFHQLYNITNGIYQWEDIVLS
jgi:rhodanese-related sulfurtransferase